MMMLLFAALQVGAQVVDIGAAAGASDEPMVAPPPVNPAGESVALTTELERSNYLRGGVAFEGAYNDNIFTSTPPVGDASYTIYPTIEFDMTRSRLHWDLNYTPGFTFFQKFTDANQVDHLFSTDLSYRMSPHVTLSLHDNLAKTPSFSGFLQPSSATGSSAVQATTFLIVPALTNTFSNSSSGQITYQFARDTMLGFGGSSSQTYFLDDNTSATGLFDSSSRSGRAFYTHRFGSKNYLGANYEFEDIESHPIELETQVHSASLFYTFYLGPHVSFSLFGGAQHSDTRGSGFPSLMSWSPTEGGGMNWQGERNSFALNVSRSILPGGGLQGAVNSFSMTASSHHQLTPHLTGNLQASYSTNDVLQLGSLAQTSGHIFMFSGYCSRVLGKHLSAELGYSRINQHYNNFAAISGNPDIDRGWIRIAYQFERPLGR